MIVASETYASLMLLNFFKFLFLFCMIEQESTISASYKLNHPKNSGA